LGASFPSGHSFPGAKATGGNPDIVGVKKDDVLFGQAGRRSAGLLGVPSRGSLKDQIIPPLEDTELRTKSRRRPCASRSDESVGESAKGTPAAGEARTDAPGRRADTVVQQTAGNSASGSSLNLAGWSDPREGIAHGHVLAPDTTSAEESCLVRGRKSASSTRRTNTAESDVHLIDASIEAAARQRTLCSEREAHHELIDAVAAVTRDDGATAEALRQVRIPCILI
jgi:hypothetical protein